jgi:hypothetical protein
MRTATRTSEHVRQEERAAIVARAGTGPAAPLDRRAAARLGQVSPPAPAASVPSCSRPPAAALVAADARYLLEQRPPLLRPVRAPGPCLAVNGKGFSARWARQSTVSQPDPLAVQEVLVLTGG